MCENSTDTDYTSKPAADIIRSHYQNAIRFGDEADGWVDGYPNTPVHAPPPGWSDNGESGGLLRGYHTGELLWSHTRGTFSFSRYGDNGLLENGRAISPQLNNMDIGAYPFLSVRIHQYDRRILDQGDCRLLVKVTEFGVTSPALLNIDPQIFTSPETSKIYTVDLRSYLGSGPHTFQIVLELAPEGGDGYSATYELDWVRIQSHNSAFDLNDDWKVGLADGILALKVLASMNPPEVRSDVAELRHGDSSVGLEHAVYSLQVAAGLK